jgi:hypothetical protein
VQAELSLEKVKPLRNELNDCDVEIIQTGAAAGRRNPKAVLVRPQPAGAFGALNRLTTKWFGSDHLQAR